MFVFAYMCLYLLICVYICVCLLIFAYICLYLFMIERGTSGDLYVSAVSGDGGGNGEEPLDLNRDVNPGGSVSYVSAPTVVRVCTGHHASPCLQLLGPNPIVRYCGITDSALFALPLIELRAPAWFSPRCLPVICLNEVC